MILVRTDWPDFKSYLASLSRTAKKNYRALHYNLEYEEVSLSPRVEEFMKLWGRQLIRGKNIEWAFPISHIERLAALGELKIFDAGLAMQFIQRRDGYWECHPPMYDKKHKGLGTWMWFRLIKYAIENQFYPLNLGGGIDEWRAMIKRRKEFPNPTYKWRFIPQAAKDHPDSEPDYYIEQWQLRLRT